MTLKEEIKMQDLIPLKYPISFIPYPCPSPGDNILYITLPEGDCNSYLLVTTKGKIKHFLF